MHHEHSPEALSNKLKTYGNLSS